MRSKINYYILIPKGELERFSKSLNKAIVAISINVKELGDAFERMTKALRDINFMNNNISK